MRHEDIRLDISEDCQASLVGPLAGIVSRGDGPSPRFFLLGWWLELVYTADSKSVEHKLMRVRLPPSLERELNALS